VEDTANVCMTSISEQYPIFLFFKTEL